MFLSLKILYTVWLFYNIAVCIYNFGASTPDMMGFEPGALHVQTGALFLNHTSALLCKAWLNSFPPCRHLLLPTSFSGWLSAPLYRPGRTEDILKTPPETMDHKEMRISPGISYWEKESAPSRGSLSPRKTFHTVLTTPDHLTGWDWSPDSDGSEVAGPHLGQDCFDVHSPWPSI